MLATWDEEEQHLSGWTHGGSFEKFAGVARVVLQKLHFSKVWLLWASPIWREVGPTSAKSVSERPKFSEAPVETHTVLLRLAILNSDLNRLSCDPTVLQAQKNRVTIWKSLGESDGNLAEPRASLQETPAEASESSFERSKFLRESRGGLWSSCDHPEGHDVSNTTGQQGLRLLCVSS